MPYSQNLQLYIVFFLNHDCLYLLLDNVSQFDSNTNEAQQTAMEKYTFNQWISLAVKMHLTD